MTARLQEEIALQQCFLAVDLQAAGLWPLSSVFMYRCTKCDLQGGTLPVTFTAAKSALGHAEAGAGVLGMLHAAAGLSQHMSQPLTHLRALNPHGHQHPGGRKVSRQPAEAGRTLGSAVQGTHALASAHSPSR